MKMITFKLEKGTVIKWKLGLPLRLKQDVEVETSEGNYKFLSSQSPEFCVRPTQPKLRETFIANKASFESV